MSLVYSAIVPHPPLLIPSIGKENTELIKSTVASFKKIEESLYACGVETILIISPHGIVQANAFTMNLSPEFIAKFEDFGDFSTKLSLRGDVGLAHRIKESLETVAPLQLISQHELDHGVSVPLYLLVKNIPRVKIIPLYYSGLDLEAHFKFGQLLKRELIYSKNKIAVIASGDLSHRLSQDAPAGYSPKAKKFDQKIIEYLSKNQAREILEMSHKLINEASECGLKSIVILLGIMEGIKHQPLKLSYEAPFGVGYLTLEFKL